MRLPFKIMLGIVLLLFGLAVIASLLQGATDPIGSAPVAEPEPPDVVEHRVVLREDVSTGPAARTVLRVRVPAGTTRSDLESLSTHLVAQERQTHPYDGLSVHFSDRADVKAASPLGWATDAPFGEWGRAGESDGSYTNHRTDLSTLREMDWTRRPTDEDIEADDLYRALGERDMAAHGEFTMEHEERVALVAEELDRSSESVHESVMRVSDWTTGIARK